MTGLRSRERGFALLAVLWAAAMLAIIVASMMSTGRSETLIARNRARVAEAQATADAAINIVILHMLDTDRHSQPPTDGRIFAVSFAGKQVRLSVQDESGKIDLNAANDGLIMRLLQVAGVDAGTARVLTDRIVDWRGGNVVQRVSDGAPASPVDAAFSPRHGAFPSVAELRLVPGIDAALFARLAPSVTVYSGSPWIDPTYADSDVVQATTGADAAKAEATLAARAGAPAPGAVRGHAFTITAERDQDGVRMVRRTAVRISSNPNMPVRVYAWDRVTP